MSRGCPSLNQVFRLFFLFTVLRPAQELFTYVETSPLPVAKFRPMLGAQGL
jgi:hypothetical protein